jgi:hypothetical protein
VKSRRTTISSLMVVVFVSAIFLSVGRYQSGPRDPTEILLIGLAFLLTMPVVQTRQTHWLSAHPDFAPLDADGPDVPKAASESLRNGKAALSSLGFTHAGDFVSTAPGPNGRSFVSLFVNHQTHEIAKILRVEVNTMLARRSHTWLAFISELSDGTRLFTTNSTVTPLTPRLGIRKGSMSFPGIRRGVRLLYDVHRASFDRFVGSAAQRIPLEDDPVDYVNREEEEDLRRMAATGYYALDEANGVYRPTWKGAFLMVGKILWPISLVRRLRRKAKAERTLRELDLA